MTRSDITGVILAGGQARRMGGQDKGLIKLLNKPMIEYVLNALQPQVATIIINANRNHDAYQQYDYPVVADKFDEHYGPLAGMAAGLEISATAFIVTAPCDAPLISSTLVNKLYTTLQNENAEICTSYCNDRLQPVFTLIKSTLLLSIVNFLQRGERKIDKWFNEHRLAIADFSNEVECFSNINSTAELQNMELKLR